MITIQEMYREKYKTPEEIADLFESGYVSVSPICVGEPHGILEAVGQRVRQGKVERLVHHGILANQGKAFLEPELDGRYNHVSWFTGTAARKGIQQGYIDQMPCNYSDVPALWSIVPKLDVFAAVVSPMDEHGYFSLGLVCGEAMAEFEKAKYVFLEENQYMPRTFGKNMIHISQVTAVCRHDAPIPELPSAPVSDMDKKIGDMIADMVPNGATLQFGIGSIPNAVGKALFDKKDLGIHTEMFTDSMVELIEAGVVTNDKKKINRGKSVTTFCWGSKKMYDFLDNNMGVDMLPVDYVNNPAVIAQHDNFISVNACLEVDLIGQVCSESMGYVPFSGTGGQSDYVRGSIMSKGGKSIIAMYSTAKNETVSKIKPILTPGAVVSTSKNDVDYIVTEYGAAKLRGKTIGQRVRELIQIAHPKFREELLLSLIHI